MDLDSCFEWGHVVKLHGLKGELYVYLDVDDPFRYEGVKSLFIEIKNQLVPFFVEKLQIRGSTALLKLEDVHSIEEAQKLLSCRLFLPDDWLPDLGKDRFYYHELIGYTVVDRLAGKLGEITRIYDSNGPYLAGMIYQDREVLIPVVDSLITRLDKEKKQIFVELPDGLLEIYLDS